MKKQKKVYQVYYTNPSHSNLHFFLKSHCGDIFLFATYILSASIRTIVMVFVPITFFAILKIRESNVLKSILDAM